MEVILLERVRKLGIMGDIVNVKDGFARNYLLPLKIALRATASNLKIFAARKTQLETDNLTFKKEATAVSARMEGLTMVMVRHAGASGQLYGSVSARDIVEAAQISGFKVNRAQVTFPKAIKEVGLHPVHIHLHPEVTVEALVSVALTEEEAQLQIENGGRLAETVEKRTSTVNKASLENDSNY